MRAFVVMVPLLMVIVSIPVLVGFYVYRDAERRGMNAALWTLIAVFVPSLIGFIIYLLVRRDYSDLECPGCGNLVEPEWKVCPMCMAPLPEYEDELEEPVRNKDKTLWKILMTIIIVPALLIALMIVLAITGWSALGGSSIGICELSFTDYQDELDSVVIYEKVQEWVDSLEIKRNHAYALQYEYPSDGQTEQFYLIYVPGAGGHTNTGAGQSSGLFGRSLNLELHSNSAGDYLINIIASNSDNKTPKLKIKLDGKKIPCEVTEVDYNPTVFTIEPKHLEE